MRALGKVTEVLSKYQEFLDDLSQPPAPPASEVSAAKAVSPLDASVPVQESPASHPVGFARIRSVEVSVDGHVGQELYGDSGRSVLEMRIAFSSDPLLPSPSAGLVISSDGGRILATHFATSQGVVMARNELGEGVAQIRVPNLPLNKGRFRIGAYLMCEKDVHVYQWIDPVAHVQMHRDGHDQGYWMLSGEWSSPEPSGLT